jgi:hypothetical protein
VRTAILRCERALQQRFHARADHRARLVERDRPALVRAENDIERVDESGAVSTSVPSRSKTNGGRGMRSAKRGAARRHVAQSGKAGDSLRRLCRRRRRARYWQAPISSSAPIP